MVLTRRSLGTPSNQNDAKIPRNSLSPSKNYKKLYPQLTEIDSYISTTSTTIQKTSEIADDNELLSTDQDSSFASSCSSSSRTSKSTAESSRKYWLKAGIAFFLVVFLAICAGILFRTEGSNENVSAYDNYIKSIRTAISNDFPDISKDNREILRLMGRKLYLEPDNHAPLVILIGGAQAKTFSYAINKVISGEAQQSAPIRVRSGVYRADLHEQLKNALTSSEPKSSEVRPHSAVVLDVDLLEWDAVLVLHAFADHGSFPVPKTVLLLTVSEENVSGDSENCDGEMVRFLTNRWIQNGGSSDNIPPIIARISYFLCV